MPVAGVWLVDQTESAAVLVGRQRSRFFKYMDKITLGMKGKIFANLATGIIRIGQQIFGLFDPHTENIIADGLTGLFLK